MEQTVAIPKQSGLNITETYLCKIDIDKLFYRI